jgi:hypothetical protein
VSRATVPSPGLLDIPEEEPIVFAGQPEALEGELPLRNAGDGRVVLRAARLRAGLENERGDVLPGMDQAIRPVVLRPGQARRVMVSLGIEPHTPPGEYRGEVELSGQVRPIVVHVTESMQLEISPVPVVVPNRPGETAKKRVVFRNGGNVPLVIGEIGGVPLDDELLECRSLRAALEVWGDEGGTVEGFLAESIRQARKVLQRAGVLRVHNPTPLTLAPGEVRSVELEIRVPKDLDERTRYLGSAALYTSDLEFLVVPSRERAGAEPQQSRRKR